MSTGNVLLDGVIAAGATGIGYLLGRPKRKAETHQAEASATLSEMEATEKAIAIWRVLAEDLKEEVDKLRTLIGELKSENNRLREELTELKEKIQEFITVMIDKVPDAEKDKIKQFIAIVSQ